ncbi:MAG: chitinase [Acidobacteria bacterium]|nr:MAG: chitinase [Acidobacteriota bacterium]PYY02897.1 MAG: chitinase [Acidobacteriota bacterium]PYY22661.1 MAG: chitinase [Acidobacteriota bacterium]
MQRLDPSEREVNIRAGAPRSTSRLAALIVLLLPTLASAQAAHPQLVGYYAERHASNGDYPLKQLATNGAAGLLTQLNYAFGKISQSRCQLLDANLELKRAYSASDSVDGAADSTDPNQLRGTFHQLQELKKQFPKLKILISLGGWINSEGFSDAAHPANVRAFVRSCIDMYVHGNFASGIHAPGIFDGVDIDWEYPVDGGLIPGRPEDTKNLNVMAAEFRRQLDAVRPGLLLTAAIPATQEDYKHYDLRTLGRYMNYINIMAYDMHWNGEKVTNLHSALFHDPADPSKPPEDTHFGAHAVQDFLHTGVPARKIMLGVPFYGKGWTGVGNANHGLYQPAKEASKSSPEYRNLKAWPGSADRQFYPKSATCSIWNKGEFFSYDCPEALQAKRQYVRQHGLAGLMFWDMGQDTSEADLLKALAAK